MHCVSSSTNFSIQYVWISFYIFHDVLSRRSSYCHCRNCPHSSNLGQPSWSFLILAEFRWSTAFRFTSLQSVQVQWVGWWFWVFPSQFVRWIHTINQLEAVDELLWHWLYCLFLILCVIVGFSIDLFFRNNLKTSLLDSTIHTCHYGYPTCYWHTAFP